MQFVTPFNVIAAILLLVPYLGVAFLPDSAATRVQAFPLWMKLAFPTLLSIPYALVACGAGVFHWQWFVLYTALPAGITALLWQASGCDPAPSPLRPGAAGEPDAQRGNWRDFLVLIALGLAIDLRWFERAWPPHLAIFNKILLLDAGIYGFVLIRQLGGTGFDLRVRPKDVAIGLREVFFYTPIAIALGFWLGFLHTHGAWPGFARIPVAWIFTFFFIAVPEELFFRGWLQNLLEKRIGRYGALFVTACLFGLAHFNKRTTANFNWRYVLLAAIAGIFYGRAWRHNRCVGASAVTHATVDTIWSLWLR